ncbi:MAG: helix-turn-helix transcriptional regulator [Microbacteriaceae bacterium]|nr:helix-turn-helix transcriptional regulator [Microbacteriaceae bacterium]
MPAQPTEEIDPVDAREYNALCSISRAVDILGPRWNFQILREALAGVTRFADFREMLGVSPDVLSARLSALVDAGVLERRKYHAPGERGRDEYLLTQAGRELNVVISALRDWGDVWAPGEFGPISRRMRRGDDAPVHVAYVDESGHEVAAEETYSRPMEATPAVGFYARRAELVARAEATR